ncbi:type II toxin-antitoxin system RelE/ParE family toxin [Litorimonas sp.]|uniref:type II toxin-antitoxin system RelE/ParE family toxin n=1 Tax=Litorimonas sp. TaxID=1892381 RepID=UPI003A89353E
MIMQTVAETPMFIKQAAKLFSNAEKKAVIDFLAANPYAGDLIPHTGGVRKVRVPASGRGKRGGARVIYYVFNEDAPLYALLVYAKKQSTNLTPEEAKAVSAFAEAIKAHYRSKS